MGFTLTELIVTLAVSAILLSVAVAGIVAWVHHADFVRNENYAETIYYAAQSELTRYRGNGQLAELAEYVEKENLVVPVEEIDPAIGVEYKGRLYYLKKDAGDVDEDSLLGGWLSDYIYDGSIMEGAICIEFDPMDGTVYSVSYSDRNVGFTYDEGNTAGEKVSLLKRAEDIRKKQRWGYYSVELSEAAPSAVGKTRLNRIELVNAEQLYLRWSLPRSYSGIRGFLSYTIEIYEKAQTAGEEDELKYTFTVKGSELKQKGSGDSITQATQEGDKLKYAVTCADANGDKFDFIAYMDENGEMYLVLDSVDYGVDPEKIVSETPGVSAPSFKTDAFRNSASVLQLFAEPEDIYVKLQASGKLYKASAKKQSNTSNTMFASMKETEAEYIYEIKNARHLYNIRYREAENGLALFASGKNLYYRQTADIVWLSDDEKLFHSTSAELGVPASGMKMKGLDGTDKCIPVGETAAISYFPAIPFLMGNSTLEVPERSRAYELMNFVLYQEDPNRPAADETEEPAAGETGKLGIIAENSGVIQRLTVTDVRAQGYENVGAVCGVNKGEGKVWNTTVSGKVTGIENVGGLVGLDKTNSVIPDGTNRVELLEEDLKKSSYINLINYAEVTGTGGKIGGIVGILGENGQIYLCENYGAVKGTETCAVYIGGISGYNKGLVQNCLSAPDDAPARNDDETLKRAELKGIFVGGIAGCNDGGVIKNSGTEKESKNLTGKRSDSYIIGYRYVGGIVGYNNGMADGEDRTTVGTLVNTDSGKTNKANVVGHDYVGGIVGANGKLEKSDEIGENITEAQKRAFETCEIEEKYSDQILVKGWTNEGLVEAVGSYESDGTTYDREGLYAGGIAGYNAGDLDGCTTRINTSSSGAQTLIEQVRLYGENASYVGGVTGYNIGYIYYKDETDETKTISVNSVVSGKKYVGGIVGYNGRAAEVSSSADVKNSGKIEKYALSGGYISGKAYVGGYAGLNTAENLLGGTLSANPNEVTADYFAGGVMGALILAPEESNTTAITVKCETNNFFGSITAENAFAGGYVGYTQLLKTGENAKVRAEALYGKVEGKSTQELAKTVLDERLEPGIDNTERGLEFAYSEEQPGESSFASVEASVFAGGVIGGNSWNTKLLLENINNQVRVTGTDSVTYGYISSHVHDKGDGEKQDTFSFAGGIIGLVTPEAEIVSCGNSNAGGVDGKGTYSGGIAEVNLGKIRKCTVSSVSGVSYYGGIAGLNTNDGTIKDCHLNGQISGEGHLGGIVVCNESVIQNCTVGNYSAGNESAVIGDGEYIGGIAAVSRVKEPYHNEITNCSVHSSIGAENLGEAVGGLVGRYEGGTLNKCSVRSSAQDIDITICGADRVGGIAGAIYADLDMNATSVSNYAEVKATGTAGGIGGYLAPGVSVIECQNAGVVRSTGNLAGGIVPEIQENSTVRGCRNYGNVEAVCMTAGGIAAKNNGIIESCIMSSESEGILITGVGAIGGIAGENQGEVKGCSISGDVTVRDINASGKDCAIGGIVGRNTGIISDSVAEVDDSNDRRPKVTTLSNGSYLGGIAGTNMPGVIGTDTGKVEGCAAKLDVSLSVGQSGTIGGAVGANGGSVSEVTFSGIVSGTAGSQYGTGGIAGRNEFGNTAGSISGCILSNGTVRAESRDTGFGGHNDSIKGVYVGGICGVNPDEGSITGCSLEGGSDVLGDCGYVGGIVAYNLGKLSKNKPKEDDDKPRIHNMDNSTNSTNKCVMGGIAGYNGVSGILEDCATGKWEINNEMNGDTLETYPTGGIIGSNKSVYDQSNLVNYANVRGNWMTGGIIGQQFTEASGGFTIENCRNYGEVTGNIRCAGGIISDWRGQSGRVRESINKGKIVILHNDGRNAAGGIIGSGYNGTETAITIERCGNEGDVYHSEDQDNKEGRAGGIFGVYNSLAAAINLTITDCYNAAFIQNEGTGDSNAVSAGIFAGDENGGTVNLTILRCVNYGKGTDTGKPFAGIVSSKRSSGSKRVELCLNVGECYGNQTAIAYNMPHHDTEDNKGNYYFSNPSEVDFGYNDIKRGSQAAKLNGNAFEEISGKTWFDTANNRLYLAPDRNKYIQFTKVSGTYQAGGNKEQILALKNNFSAGRDPYALMVYGMNSGVFEAPSQVVLEETDGIYKVTYEGHPDVIFCTAGYELEIEGYVEASGTWEVLKKEEITDPTKNTYTIAEGDLFEGKVQTQYTELKARVRAVKADGYDGITPHISENEKDYSDWTESDRLTTKPKLPMPQVHFEVTDATDEEMTNSNLNNRMHGYWVLDNAEDYKDYGEDWDIELRLDNTLLNDGISGGKVRSDWGYFTKAASSSNDNRRTVTAFAKPTNAGSPYTQSDTFMESLCWYPRGATLKAEHVSTDGGGEFIGTKAGELSYRFLMRQSAGNYRYINITCMAELWLDGKKLGEGTVVLPNQQGEEYCTIDLSSLDQDTIRELIENIAESDSGKPVTVCFYPWEVGNVKYYVTDDETKEIKSRTIPEAYEKAGESAFNSSYQQFTLNGMTGYKMYPIPEAGDNVITEMTDDGTIKYTLYWDGTADNNGTITPSSGDAYKNAEYVVTVTGKTGDTEVMLHQETIKVDDNTPPAVTLTENNWKYEQLVLNVERLGGVSEGIHYIGASSEETYNIPIRLSSISKPNAKLRDRNTVVFLVDWVKSAEDGVIGYRIIMTGKDANGNSIKTITHDVTGKDAVNAEIDLDDAAYVALSGAKEIEFSIVVLSDPDDIGHLDSRESRKEHCTIPERLPEPDEMPKLKQADGTEAKPEDALTPEKFAELRLHLEDSDASSEDAAYQIEYFVADKDAQVMGGLPADWKQNGGERPELNSEKGIYISKEPDAMTGNLRSAIYVLNQLGSPFNAEQAGRMLWYRVREVSNSKISSPWTVWESITLPKVLLEPVVIPEGQTADRECVYTINGVENEANVITMRQPKLGFAPVLFAKGYAINITEADRIKHEFNETNGQIEEKEVPGAQHSYTLEKTASPEGAESLVLKEGGTEIEVEFEETSASGETIRTFKPLYTIEHSFKIQGGTGTSIYAITTSARLCYSIKNGTIQEIWLELPDGETLADDGTSVSSNSFIGTATADITVIPPDPDRYVVNELTRWQRDATNTEEIKITNESVESTSIAVAGYFEDELNMQQLSDQALQLFGLSRLPEEELQEEAEKEESDSEKSDVSGNNVFDSNNDISDAKNQRDPSEF